MKVIIKIICILKDINALKKNFLGKNLNDIFKTLIIKALKLLKYIKIKNIL